MPTANQILGLRSSCASAGTTVATVGAGYARDTTDSDWIEIPSGQTRDVDLSHTGIGGLDTGTVQPKTAYALYVVKTAGGVVAAYASQSYVAPSSLPGGAVFRRVGSLFTNSTSKVVAFQQTGTGNDRVVTFESDAGDLVVVANQSSATFKDFDNSPPASKKLNQSQVQCTPSTGGTTELRGAGSVVTTVTVPSVVWISIPPTSSWGQFRTPVGTTTLSVIGFGESV